MTILAGKFNDIMSQCKRTGVYFYDKVSVKGTDTGLIQGTDTGLIQGTDTGLIQGADTGLIRRALLELILKWMSTPRQA